MKAVRSSLLAWAMLIGVHAAVAKAPSPVPAIATPTSSPGEWITSNDYPAVAWHYGMAGTTAFRLAIDMTGKPSRCDIVQSSGFDVLDGAACQRLMANARFSPARDRSGKPVESSYSSRIIWAIPDSIPHIMSENFISTLLSIDQKGKVTSCKWVLHLPADANAPVEKPCGIGMKMPPAVGMEFSGNSQDGSAEVVIQQADAFTADLRARVLSPMPGYEQRGLNIYHFTVTRDGKLGQCTYEEQRGSEDLAWDFCSSIRSASFDPPFSAFDKDGVASGWHIVRTLLKTGPETK